MQRYSRLIKFPKNESIFLLGPRGTGKTLFLKENYPDALYFDLLDESLLLEFLANPGTLAKRIPESASCVIIDEVQKAPTLLNEIHRLIENRKIKFILTGSSARKLRKEGANLLAGRALQYNMNPFSSIELGKDFNPFKALQTGLLPKAYLGENSERFLKSYVGMYLREEVSQEGLVRSLEGFSRFLQVASYSQASLLNISKIAQESSLGRQAVYGYFDILKDLLLSIELPIFSHRAKREMVKHKKFYFFDVGVFQALRPRGPLDSDAELNGIKLETLILQDLKALKDSLEWDLEIYFWRTLREKHEVDFVLYGKNILTAIEVKASARLRPEDFKGLAAIKTDYPTIQTKLIYLGDKEYFHDGIQIIPIHKWFALSPQQRIE